MARAKQKLRGSVSQSVPGRRPGDEDSPWFSFGARLAILIVAACLAILCAAWFFKSSWPERQESRLSGAALHLTQKANFAVKDIAVEGRTHTDKTDLFAALGASASMPIFAFDPEEAAERVRALPWVENVVIERRLPDGIYVRLTERTPIARWQNQGRTVVIDHEGKELKGASPDEFAKLPLVVGTDAPQNAEALLVELRAYPEIQNVLKAAGRVGARRWDLYLQPKVVARLPEDDLPNALRRLSTLIRDQKILERAIIAIDLRVADRLTIEPVAEAAPDVKEQRK